MCGMLLIFLVLTRDSELGRCTFKRIVISLALGVVSLPGLTKHRKGLHRTAKEQKYDKGLLARRKLPKFCNFLPLSVECK